MLKRYGESAVVAVMHSSCLKGGPFLCLFSCLSFSCQCNVVLMFCTKVQKQQLESKFILHFRVMISGVSWFVPMRLVRRWPCDVTAQTTLVSKSGYSTMIV